MADTYMVCCLFLWNMETLFGLFITAFIIFTVTNAYLMKNFMKQLLEKIEQHPPSGNITVPFKESKNQVDEEDKDVVEFAEGNPLNLPSDVKIEIEGGDTFMPGNYPKGGVAHNA